MNTNIHADTHNFALFTRCACTNRDHDVKHILD